MKKNLFFKLLLLVALTISISCQPDDEQTTIKKPKGGITSKIINFDQFKANTKALKELKKRHREQSFRKTIYDSSGFYYNEDYVLNIYYKDYTTYTIPIYRETESRFVENLVIREKSTGEIDSYIFSYDLTNHDRSNLINNDRIEYLEEKLRIKNNVIGDNDGYIYRINGNCYHFTCYDAQGNYLCDGDEGEGPIFIQIDCPEEDPDLSYTEGENPGGGNGNGPGGFPINIVIAYPPSNPGGPVSGPGGVGGGTPSNPIFSPDPIITKPFISILVEMFNNDLKDNELDKFVWLKQHMQIRMGINSLLSGLLDGYETRKELAHRIIDFAMEDEANVEVAQQILDYLDEEDNSDESMQLVEKILDAIDDYKQQYEYDEELISEFVNDILTPEEIVEEEEIDLGPSCESFNFANTGSNWQEAAVENIHFNVVLISTQGVNMIHSINYNQTVLFGCPLILSVGNTPITAGTAATVSAQVLRRSMKETVGKYGNKPVTEMIVRIYFERRLKHNYPMALPGGRVNFNPTNFSVIPTQYQTNLFGTGDCE